MPTTLQVLIGGVVFVGGFAAGSATFSRVLRHRERRLAIKLRAAEAARLALHRQGVELDAWVVDVVDRERQAARHRRQAWWRRCRRWSK